VWYRLCVLWWRRRHKKADSPYQYVVTYVDNLGKASPEVPTVPCGTVVAGKDVKLTISGVPADANRIKIYRKIPKGAKW